MKKQQKLKNPGGNIPGGNFWVRIFRRGIHQGGV